MMGGYVFGFWRTVFVSAVAIWARHIIHPLVVVAVWGVVQVIILSAHSAAVDGRRFSLDLDHGGVAFVLCFLTYFALNWIVGRSETLILLALAVSFVMAVLEFRTYRR
jgi:hypothetical protein